MVSTVPGRSKKSIRAASAGHPQGCVHCSGSSLDFRRFPIAYRDFSQNAQNGQKSAPKWGTPPEKTRFLTCARYTPHLGVGRVAQMRFSSHPHHQKVTKKRTSAHESKFIWGVYLAQVGDPSGGRGVPFKHPVAVDQKSHPCACF